ncbi:hypothetical protein [Shewanella sp. 0m-4]
MGRIGSNSTFKDMIFGSSSTSSSTVDSQSRIDSKTSTVKAEDEKAELIKGFLTQTDKLNSDFEMKFELHQKDVAVINRKLTDQEQKFVEQSQRIVDLNAELLAYKGAVESNKNGHVIWLVGIAAISLATVVGGYWYLDSKFETMKNEVSTFQTDTSKQLGEITTKLGDLDDNTSDIKENSLLLAKTREEHIKTLTIVSILNEDREKVLVNVTKSAQKQ